MFGLVWIATYEGLVKFNGTTWTVYNTSNSGIPNNVEVLNVDVHGNIWIGAGSLIKFNGVNWTVYNTLNSGLPLDWVSAIAIDKQDNKWIGTWGGGLAKFDGISWNVYNIFNSGLSTKHISAVAVDNLGNKWIGERGLTVYREGGVILYVDEKDDKILSDEITLYQNYPNPFNPSTTISFYLPVNSKISLIIYNILGQEVIRLIDNREFSKGRHSITWNGKDKNGEQISSGIYFYKLKSGSFEKTQKMMLIK